MMRRSTFILFYLVLTSVACAQPMWIKNGSTSGQGYAFDVARQCIAVTPAHVVRGATKGVRLTDVKGDALFATVVAKDEKKDIALLLVGEASDRVECRSPGMISIARLDEYEPTWIPMPGAWFDLIASPAGGLDRFDVALPKRPPSVTATEFTVSRKIGPDPEVAKSVEGYTASGWDRRSDAPAGRFDRMPMQGNSGAMLWIGSRDTAHFTNGRYEGETVRTDAVGNVAGMLLRVGGDRAYVLTVPVITEFIASTLRPIDASKLLIDSAGATITDRGRGSQIGFHRGMSYELLTDLSTEFDLGDEDTEFHGVTILYDVRGDSDNLYDPHPRFRADPHMGVDLVMGVSQYRPREGKDWRSAKCKEYKWTHVPETGRPEQIRLKCELERAVVARGIRITLRGVPGRWRGLTLNLVR